MLLLSNVVRSTKKTNNTNSNPVFKVKFLYIFGRDNGTSGSKAGVMYSIVQ